MLSIAKIDQLWQLAKFSPSTFQ